MTPDDIRSQRFSSRLLHGLSPEEVSAFLEDVAEAYAGVQDANATLTVQVKALTDQVQSLSTRTAPPIVQAAEAPADSGHIEVLRSAVLREVEALLHDAQAQVQALLEGAQAREAEMLRDVEAARARLRVEGEELVAAATARAEALVATAREEEADIRTEIDRLTQSRLKLVDDVRATLDSYHHWLATVDPRGRARGRHETLDTSDGHGAGTVAVEESRAG